jgi:hypothetical protein
MPKELSLAQQISDDCCFDLQFRKDTLSNRPHSPTYYRWKAQFIITRPKRDGAVLKKFRQEVGCGSVTGSGNQLRFSVQSMDDIRNAIIPYFQKHPLGGTKHNDFSLWKNAADIICENKGKKLSDWKKSDLNRLLQIQKAGAKYKRAGKKHKWMEMAQAIAQKK